VLTMRNLTHSFLPLVLTALLIPAAAPATASASSATAQGAANQSRLGRGFGSRRSPSFGSRSRYRSRYPTRPYRRPFGVRRFFGGVLKVLGMAYLFHLLFGWGAGGSPFGLLLLLGIVVLLASRRRRRPLYY
jgi:hypothetical protein